MTNQTTPNPMTDPCVEAVARAIYDSAQRENGNHSAVPWDIARAGETGPKWKAYAEAAIAAMHSSRPVEDGLDAVIAEIERYGEGLVPELRIVTTWLANHFRDEEVKAELKATQASELSALKQEIERLRAALDMAYSRWMISCHADNDFPDWPDDAAAVMNDLWKEGWPEQARQALTPEKPA